MINDNFYRRRYVISGIVVAIVVVFIIRVFCFQVLDPTTRDRADKNALVKQMIFPSRGLIYDRNGELLVYNQPIYEVTLVMRELGNTFDTVQFCNCLGIDTVFFNERVKVMRNARGYSSFTPQIFINQLSKADIATLQQSLHLFSGIDIRKRNLRDYRYNAACHLLGSVGEVNQNDIDNDNYYAAGDYSGRDGLERTYEHRLRGQKGVEILMRDSRGIIRGSFRDGEYDESALAGENLTISIDIHLQQLAERMLKGKIGSIVAIEPKTGEVLVLASNPGWDPKMLVGRERSKNYTRLATDRHKPLMNRATQAMYSPGSTFKTLQTLVCLQEGGITPSTMYPCSGPGSSPIKCTHHHGSPVSLINAIEQSCNPYFWCAFRDMLQKDSKDNDGFHRRYNIWRNDVMRFGLGSRFNDSDIAGQVAGSIPSEEMYNRYYGKTGWKAATIRSLSIGQGEILVTPLQLANQAATIANGGYYLTPHLLIDSTLVVQRHETNIKSEYFSLVQQGMHRVMTNGTGRWNNIDSLQMCGKTGTVQNVHGRDHAIFIGFAPMDNPRIAVAVVVENAGFGASWAAPMASLIMEQYLTDTIERKDLLNRMESAILIQ